jgi:hypothetical protein
MMPSKGVRLIWGGLYLRILLIAEMPTFETHVVPHNVEDVGGS